MLFTFKFKKWEDEYTKYKKIIEAKRKQCDLEGRYCMFDKNKRCSIYNIYSTDSN